MRGVLLIFASGMAISALAAIYQAHEAQIESRHRDFAEFMFLAWIRGFAGLGAAGYAIWG